jgi:hypothetical protein
LVLTGSESRDEVAPPLPTIEEAFQARKKIEGYLI